MLKLLSRIRFQIQETRVEIEESKLYSGGKELGGGGRGTTAAFHLPKAGSPGVGDIFNFANVSHSPRGFTPLEKAK